MGITTGAGLMNPCDRQAWGVANTPVYVDSMPASYSSLRHYLLCDLQYTTTSAPIHDIWYARSQRIRSRMTRP